MTSINQQRKDDHVKLALEQQGQDIPSVFDDIRFVHHSFSSVDYQQIDLSTNWAGQRHSLPFFINGMTGGSAYTHQINEILAQLARETGIAMASGSNSIALKEAQTVDSFKVIREKNPHGFVLANLGAHHDLENAKKVVDLLQANALQIHLNLAQEVVMPEGDRDFSTWIENIQAIQQGLDVPIIVKEVGFGMSRETLQILREIGVQTVDISGRGGTNFLTIENQRRKQIDFSSLANWGQTTAEALLESIAFQDSMEIIASGGIRHFYDIAKAFALGARATGISGKILTIVHQDGLQAGIDLVNEWIQALKQMCLLLNAQSITDLTHKQVVISGNLKVWADQRKIDYHAIANR